MTMKTTSQAFRLHHRRHLLEEEELGEWGEERRRRLSYGRYKAMSKEGIDMSIRCAEVTSRGTMGYFGYDPSKYTKRLTHRNTQHEWRRVS